MLVLDIAQAQHMHDALHNSEFVAIDTETNMTEDAFRRFLVGISCATEHQTFYIPVAHTDFLGQGDLFKEGDGPVLNFPAGVQFLEDALSSGIPKQLIFHNAKFDLTVLERAGIKLPGVVWDTMLMSHLIDEHPPHGLKELGAERLGREEAPGIARMLKNITKTTGYEGVHPVAMAVYAEQDARLTYDLYFDLLPDLQEQELMEVYDNDMRFMLLLKKLELAGVRYDRERSLLLAQQTNIRMGQIRQTELGFDPAKSSVLESKLFGVPPSGLGLVPLSVSPKTGKPVMDEAALTAINHPVAGLVLEYRGLAKAHSTWYLGFVNRLDQDNRLHPNFKQTGTLTGRPSCENPNMSQVPREADRVKSLFLPDDDCELWEFDFSQQEFHLAALYGNEEVILERLRAGEDFHTVTANLLGVPRHEAKTSNFATIYGGGPATLGRTLGIGWQAAVVFIDHMKRTFPGIFEAMEQAEYLARQNGYVKYWNGRRRHFTMPGEERKAFNSVCQGGGFEITKRALLNLDAHGYKMVNTVYDSVWVNLPKPVSPDEIERIKGLMNDWTLDTFDIRFPVDAKKMA